MNEIDMEKILKALGNKRRLKILKILKKKKISVSDIAKEMKLSIRAVSRHLNVLYTNGFLEKEQIGLTVYYTFNPARTKELSQSIAII